MLAVFRKQSEFILFYFIGLHGKESWHMCFSSLYEVFSFGL